MSGKRIIMIGGCALQYCLDYPEVKMVTVIGRHSVGMQHTHNWRADQF